MDHSKSAEHSTEESDHTGKEEGGGGQPRKGGGNQDARNVIEISSKSSRNAKQMRWQLGKKTESICKTSKKNGARDKNSLRRDQANKASERTLGPKISRALYMELGNEEKMALSREAAARKREGERGKGTETSSSEKKGREGSRKASSYSHKKINRKDSQG